MTSADRTDVPGRYTFAHRSDGTRISTWLRARSTSSSMTIMQDRRTISVTLDAAGASVDVGGLALPVAST